MLLFGRSNEIAFSRNSFLVRSNLYLGKDLNPFNMTVPVMTDEMEDNLVI